MDAAPELRAHISERENQAAELLARDGWSKRRLERHVDERLRALLAHAAKRSPHYREAFRGKDLARVPLRELPTLDKATLVAQFDRIITAPDLRLRDVLAHVASPRASRPMFGKYRVFSSSGTSGRAGFVIQSEAEFAVWLANVSRLFARAGIRRDTRFVAIGAPYPLHLTQQIGAALQNERPAAPALNVLTPASEMISALNAYQPEAILTYSGILALLARAQRDGALRIAPRIVLGVGEVLTERTRRAILEAWGIYPANAYGATEAPLLASSSPPGRTLIGYDDLCCLEVVDDRNEPVPPGVAGSKVLITNLVNWTQPLIRYELSDSVTCADAVASSPFLQIASIDGRNDDILVLPARAGGDVAVHPYVLHLPFETLNDISQYQIVQTPQCLQGRVVLQARAAPDILEKVRAALTAALEAAGAVPPPIDVVAVPALPRQAGPGAKLKLVRDERAASTT
jgi:putative adenylate-forming enzyme